MTLSTCSPPDSSSRARQNITEAYPPDALLGHLDLDLPVLLAVPLLVPVQHPGQQLPLLRVLHQAVQNIATATNTGICAAKSNLDNNPSLEILV